MNKPTEPTPSNKIQEKDQDEYRDEGEDEDNPYGYKYCETSLLPVPTGINPEHPLASPVPGGWDLSTDPDCERKLEEQWGTEDFKLLRSPRRYVRMPNMVGMKEQQAIDAAHAIGLAVRICYVYTDDISRYGNVFIQDATAGHMWNIRAGVMMNVYSNREGDRFHNPVSEPSPTPGPSPAPTPPRPLRRNQSHRQSPH